MKKAILVGLAALTLIGSAPLVFADWHPGMEEVWVTGTDWRPGIRDRIHSIRARIHEGLRNGELTPHEARRLTGELDDIKLELDDMTVDHYLSGSDRQRIVDRLNVLGERVWQLKHNDVVR